MTRCNLCGQDATEVLIEFGTHPIAHRLLDSRNDSEYVHPLTLGVCRSCGLVQLVQPIPPERLYTKYNWLSSSKWNPHLPRLLEEIEKLPGLAKSDFVLEIGSNDGSFLAELLRRGYTNVLGLEPADDAYAAAVAAGVPTEHGYFTSERMRMIAAKCGQPALLVARHVAEHVTDLRGFAATMKMALRLGSHAFVEVPDFGFNQSTPDYSAIWEEHVDHFTRATLGRFLAEVGIRVDHCESHSFSGQVLAAFGTFTGGAALAEMTSVESSRAAAYEFRDKWPRFRAAIRLYLAEKRSAGERVGVYGAGCRAAALINLCDLGSFISVVVDDQPARQGKFMPGSRLPIASSDALVDGDLDLCLLAVNAESEDGVIARHADFLSRGGEFVSICPPSPRLPEFWKELTRCAPVS